MQAHQFHDYLQFDRHNLHLHVLEVLVSTDNHTETLLLRHC